MNTKNLNSNNNKNIDTRQEKFISSYRRELYDEIPANHN